LRALLKLKLRHLQGLHSEGLHVLHMGCSVPEKVGDRINSMLILAEWLD